MTRIDIDVFLNKLEGMNIIFEVDGAGLLCGNSLTHRVLWTHTYTSLIGEAAYRKIDVSMFSAVRPTFVPVISVHASEIVNEEQVDYRYLCNYYIDLKNSVGSEPPPQIKKEPAFHEHRFLKFVRAFGL